MYKAALWEHSFPLFNRHITVPCRAKLSATHQHLEIKNPQPTLQWLRLEFGSRIILERQHRQVSDRRETGKKTIHSKTECTYATAVFWNSPIWMCKYNILINRKKDSMSPLIYWYGNYWTDKYRHSRFISWYDFPCTTINQICVHNSSVKFFAKQFWCLALWF